MAADPVLAPGTQSITHSQKYFECQIDRLYAQLCDPGGIEQLPSTLREIGDLYRKIADLYGETAEPKTPKYQQIGQLLDAIADAEDLRADRELLPEGRKATVPDLPVGGLIKNIKKVPPGNTTKILAVYRDAAAGLLRDHPTTTPHLVITLLNRIQIAYKSAST